MAKLRKGRHKSAIKAQRKSLKARLRNEKLISDIKKVFKNIKSAHEKKDVTRVSELLREYYSKVDKAVKLNIIHRNTAARKKSIAARLTQSAA